MSKSRLALVIAMMFAVPAGVVALEQAAMSSEVEVSDPAQDLLSAAAEPVTSAESAATDSEQAGQIAESEAATPAEAAVQSAANLQRVAASDTFPRIDEVGATLLPSQLAYLEGLEQQRSHLIARGDAFPTADPMDQQLPALVAYLDRADQTRLAAEQAPQIARVEASPVAAADPNLQPAGTELLVADTSAGR